MESCWPAGGRVHGEGVQSDNKAAGHLKASLKARRWLGTPEATSLLLSQKMVMILLYLACDFTGKDSNQWSDNI